MCSAENLKSADIKIFVKKLWLIKKPPTNIFHLNKFKKKLLFKKKSKTINNLQILPVGHPVLHVSKKDRQRQLLVSSLVKYFAFSLASTQQPQLQCYCKNFIKKTLLVKWILAGDVFRFWICCWCTFFNVVDESVFIALGL